MAMPNVLSSEIGYALRMLFNSIPSLRSSAEQRSDYQLLKAEVYELLAAAYPAIAAQCMQVANAARREAHAINLDY